MAWDDPEHDHDRLLRLVEIGVDRIVKAIVFVGLALMGLGLIAVVAAFKIDWFYPTFAFGVAAYMAHWYFFSYSTGQTSDAKVRDY